MFHPGLKQKIAFELSRGEAARQAGLEGRARVCARRAAGLAVHEYFQQVGAALPGTSVMDLLNAARGEPGLSAAMHQVIERLMMRVDENYSLPVEGDLLEDARWLVEELERLSGTAA